MEETVAPRLLRFRLATKLVLLSVMTVGVVFSFSRAAWLNLAVGTVVLLVVLALRRGGARRAMTLLVVTLVAGAVLFGVVTATSSLDFLTERAALQDYDTQRFDAQASGFEVAAEHPLGVGPGQFERISELSAHSTYVRALAEEGVLGLFVILGLVFLTLGFAARNVALGVDTYGIGSAGLLAAWCGLLANSFFVDTLHWRHLWFDRSLDLGRDRAPRRLPGEVGVRRGPRTHDHDSEWFHLQAVEQLPESERRLGRLAVWTADDEHSVDPLREHLAVDEPEERWPVEQDVVVLRLLDLLEETIERVAREQLRRITRHASAGQHVQTARARPRCAQLEDVAASAVPGSDEHLRQARRLIDVEELVQFGPSACPRRRATSGASPGRARGRGPP